MGDYQTSSLGLCIIYGVQVNVRDTILDSIRAPYLFLLFAFEQRNVLLSTAMYDW